MSLRDLKPGDRFTAEYEVSATNDTYVSTTMGHVFHYDRSHVLNATKLPPQARPVRKGDEIVYPGSTVPRVFIARYETGIVTTVKDRIGGPLPQYDGFPNECFHADGAPIDWEASE